MTEDGRSPRNDRTRLLVVILGVVLTFFALAHSLEDFAYGVPEERFGIHATPGALLLGGAFLLLFFYVAAGLVQAHFEGSLTSRLVAEYTVVGALGLGLIIWASPWRG